MAQRPPSKCVVCQVSRVAWTRPRVDFCYACLPGGPFAPPPCRRCGSPRYFSGGLCGDCHPGGPLYPGSCQGCLAWGVYRAYSWRCWYCRWWRTHYVEGDCRYCRRHTTIGELRACRLCLEQARMVQEPGRAVDLAAANRYGQQLFFANMHGRQSRARPIEPRRPGRSSSDKFKGRVQKRPLPKLARVATGQQFSPVSWRQLTLFDLDPDPAVVIRLAEIIDSELLRYCDEIVRDHARLHGWSTKQTNDVRRSLRLLQVLQHTPGAQIRATDVLKLPGLTGNVSAESTLDVLAAAGLLDDNRISPAERYFVKQTAGLPEPMVTQLRTWFDVMIEGSNTAPRRRPRDPLTARWQIAAIAPILRVWASTGHDSLAAIDRDEVLRALPPAGASRHLADQGFRSLFGVLKSRRLIFANPTRGVPPAAANSSIPLPLDTDAIREALNSPQPITALAVAVVAFHALAARQVRAIKLTDIVDGRLTIEGRVIPLAAPVLPRLAAWLDYRAQTWPATVNPHLFINRRTAPRLTQVSRPFPWREVSFTPQGLREDRILDEVRATGGDVRRICELFDLSVEAALRYTATTFDRSEPADHESPVPPTQGTY